MKDFLELNLPFLWTIEEHHGIYQVYIPYDSYIIQFDVAEISNEYVVYLYSLYIKRQDKATLQWIVSELQDYSWKGSKEEIVEKFLPYADKLARQLDGLQEKIENFQNLPEIQQIILKSI